MSAIVIKRNSQGFLEINFGIGPNGILVDDSVGDVNRVLESILETGVRGLNYNTSLENMIMDKFVEDMAGFKAGDSVQVEGFTAPFKVLCDQEDNGTVVVIPHDAYPDEGVRVSRFNASRLTKLLPPPPKMYTGVLR